MIYLQCYNIVSIFIYVIVSIFCMFIRVSFRLNTWRFIHVTTVCTTLQKMCNRPQNVCSFDFASMILINHCVFEACKSTCKSVHGIVCVWVCVKAYNVNANLTWILHFCCNHKDLQQDSFTIQSHGTSVQQCVWLFYNDLWITLTLVTQKRFFKVSSSSQRSISTSGVL